MYGESNWIFFDRVSGKHCGVCYYYPGSEIEGMVLVNQLDITANLPQFAPVPLDILFARDHDKWSVTG